MNTPIEKTFNFTAGRIADAKCQESKNQTFYWDTKTVGLGLRVTQNGNKSYVFQSKLHGTTYRKTIGDIRTYTISKAREEANNLKSQTDKGIDPRGIAIAHKAEMNARSIATTQQNLKEKVLVSDAWTDYIDYQKLRMGDSKAKGKKWGERHMQDHLNAMQVGGELPKRGKALTVEGVLHPLLKYRLIEVDSSVMLNWLEKENKRQKTRSAGVRQGFQKFGTFWKWCSKTEPYKNIVNKEVFLDEMLVERVPDRSDATLNDDDVLLKAYIRDWFIAVKAIPNPVISIFLQCLLITGARKNELIALRWDEIDFKSKTIRIKDKVKPARHIPLNLYMQTLILSIEKENDYVFFSLESESEHLTDPRKAHMNALEKANIPHLTIHGLRRSFASLWIWTQPDGAGARIQGHTPKTVRDKYYLKLPIELIAQWHDGYVNWLLKEAGIEITPNEGVNNEKNNSEMV